MAEIHKKEENNKIYRVFRTTIEMLLDRGYTVPEQLRNMKITEFISRYAYAATEDSAQEGLVNRDSIVLSLVKMDVEDIEADISD